MQPNGTAMRVASLAAIVALVIAAAALLVRQSSATRSIAVQSAELRLDSAERERRVVAERAEEVAARAAGARAAARAPVARADSLRARVRAVAPGQLQVAGSGADEPTLVPVPPLVIDRLEADSAAISALSVALTLDTRAAAAQEERLVAETKAREAASLTIAQLEHERSPRCGRRCAFVLGAASVVAVGIALRP